MLSFTENIRERQKRLTVIAGSVSAQLKTVRTDLGWSKRDRSSSESDPARGD
jgi:hypothetical protein